MTEDPLDDIVKDAKEAKKQYEKSRSTLEEVKEQLRDRRDEMADNDQLTQSEHEEVTTKIENGEYGKARELMVNADGKGLGFDEEEKQRFAEELQDTIDEIDETIESIRNDFMELNSKGMRRDTLEDILYSRMSNWTKKQTEKFLDVVEQIKKTGTSNDTRARLIHGFNSSINISDAKEALSNLEGTGGFE